MFIRFNAAAHLTSLRTLTLAALALAALPATMAHAAETSSALTNAVDRAFRPLLKAHDVPGIAVAVTVDGRQHFFNYGIASRETKAPVTKDTLFEIGSVSKTFAATFAAYAVAQGKLSLDEHPSKYMPALRSTPIDAASLLNLGTYTAGGLPLQLPVGVNDEASMTRYFQQWKPAAAPGVQRRYSNPSIGLFGHLTAIAMQGSYADLMDREVLPKLGLRHSFVNVPKAELANYAWGYKDGKPVRVNPGIIAGGAYGVKSSAADMIRFVEANIRPDTLDEPMRRAVEGTHVGYFKINDTVQGLGWEQYAYPLPLDRLLAGNTMRMALEPHAATALTPPQAPSGPTLFNKTGSTNGFGTYVAFVPAKKIGIVMLANKNLPTPERIKAAYAVLEVLAKDAR